MHFGICHLLAIYKTLARQKNLQLLSTSYNSVQRGTLTGHCCLILIFLQSIYRRRLNSCPVSPGGLMRQPRSSISKDTTWVDKSSWDRVSRFTRRVCHRRLVLMGLRKIFHVKVKPFCDTYVDLLVSVYLSSGCLLEGLTLWLVVYLIEWLSDRVKDRQTDRQPDGRMDPPTYLPPPPTFLANLFVLYFL